MVVVKMSFTTKFPRLFYGTVVADTGNFKLRVDDGVAFLPCVCSYAGNNLGINYYFSDLATFRADQELSSTMLMITFDMRTDDVFVRDIELMNEMFSHKKVQYPINRHRLDLLRKMTIAIINYFIGGKRLIGMQQYAQDQPPFGRKLLTSD